MTPAGEPEQKQSTVARVRAAQSYAQATLTKVEATRPQHRSLDLIMSMAEHDRTVGGGLLAGALAFRVFLWLLPAALLVVGGLGFTSRANASTAAHSAGLSNYAAKSIADAAQTSQHGRWVLLLLGAFFLYFASSTLSKTIVAATAFAWRIPVPRIAHKLRASLYTTGFLALGFVMAAASDWLRSRSQGPGVIVAVLLVIVWSAMWWIASAHLPRAEGVRWRQLWPGAIFAGVGMQVMHLITVLYLTHKISSASGLYGGLGAAATIILSAYLLARLIIASCTINAIVCVPRPTADPAA